MRWLLFFAIPVLCSASAASVYVAQTSAGAADGSSCANAYAITFFNTSGNWGSGAGKIGADTIVHFCGAITTKASVAGSGTSGHPITFLWESGARLSLAHGAITTIGGANSYLVFDGGIACGPGTTCDTVEAANLTGYAAGQTGIIEATDNGSGLGTQDTATRGLPGCDGCHDIEIKNLIIRNLYIHSSLSDQTNSADTGPTGFECAQGSTSGCVAGTISIHDSVIHDAGVGVAIGKTSSATVNVYNVDFYRNNWAMASSGGGLRTVNLHDNHIHDTTNWDTNGDTYHHNGLHIFMTTSTDSVAHNIYNNISDGDWGTCCTTATQLFVDLTCACQVPDNVNLFNNAALQYGTNTGPPWQYASLTGLFVNNTAIGIASTPANALAVHIYSSTGITYENNFIQGYGQFASINSGALASGDYNQYGTVGTSGNSPWVYASTGYNTLAAWQAACSCDSHGTKQVSVSVSAAGVPLAGSTLIGAGANLTSLSIAALDSDITGFPRSASAPWDIGAYAYQAPASAGAVISGSGYISGGVH